MWWQVGRLVIAMLMGHGVLGIMATPARAVISPVPDPSADGRTVYCLKTENARPLVAAAIAVGVARKAREDDHLRPRAGGAAKDLTVAEWARGNAADFRRACAALVAERRLPAERPGPFWRQLSATVVATVPVVLGVLLTLLVTVVTSGKTDRRRAADDLHKAVADHYRACRACLLAWRGGKGRALEKDMEAPLDALRAELKRCTIRHPGWKRPERLSAALERLDADIRGTRWPASEDRDALATTADGYLDRLDEARNTASLIIGALEHPLRGRREMRKPVP